MTLLSCTDITLDLGGRRILEGVSLQVGQAEVVGLAGPNGAGKTSLFEVLSGRQLRHGGDVTLAGTSIRQLPMRKRVELGLVRSYQRPIVPAALTVVETLKAARKAYNPKPSRLKVEWAFEFVRMRAHLNAPTGSLETLERRKLMLACLLLRDPRVVCSTSQPPDSPALRSTKLISSSANSRRNMASQFFLLSIGWNFCRWSRRASSCWTWDRSSPRVRPSRSFSLLRCGRRTSTCL